MKRINVMSAPCTVLLALTSMAALVGAEKTYQARDQNEFELIALVLKAEIGANGWSPKEAICFLVQGLNPGSDLVKNLRRSRLNVRSMTEWEKRFNCEFEIRLSYEFANSAPAKPTIVHVEVSNLRDINAGIAHFATRTRIGDYSVVKTDGNWSIKEYTPAK